jgi:CMP-N,N'-diacetyllegionaminic acid synthase
VPNKNLVPVGGRPLIVWTIQAALAARRPTRVIVSTDSPAIAQVARDAGAETPFLRPAELARDDTPGMAPLVHALRWLEAHEGYRPDALLCLQPTSPLRGAEDIDAAVDLADSTGADAVVSGVAAAQHPYWMKTLDDAGRISPFMSVTPAPARRQDLPPVYALNGAIYLARREVLLERETWYTDRTHMYVMPEERSFDVDTPWDVRLVDIILSARRAYETL